MGDVVNLRNRRKAKARADRSVKASENRVRFGRSASAPLPPDQHRAFERRFGVSVIEAEEFFGEGDIALQRFPIHRHPSLTESRPFDHSADHA